MMICEVGPWMTTISMLSATIAILMVVSPLGIWNRLIKMHRDEKAHQKAVEREAAKQTALLEQAVDLLREIAEGGYYEEEGADGQTA